MVEYWGGDDFGSKKYRLVSSVIQPKFEAPAEFHNFMRGNEECNCICKAKYLPRNAILIRPKRDSKKMYDDLMDIWKKGKMSFFAHGSCQIFLKSYIIKKEFRDIIKDAEVRCIDNVDNKSLRKGDILLTRHGGIHEKARGVGKPHLILEEL